MPTVDLHHGDCRDVLASLPEHSVDAIVCDPPYELAFMNKGWDNAGVSFDPETWRAALRVLKPGGHLLAFGGTRTVHRIAVAIEDAGFEIRDQVVWMYGSGFPKSLDVSKAMDKAAGAKREVIGRRPVSYPDSDCWSTHCQNVYADGGYSGGWKPNAEGGTRPVTAPAADLARRYDGYGTALKPAHEPVIVARKPLVGTVAANVARFGTGALNIDGCRIGTDPVTSSRSAAGMNKWRYEQGARPNDNSLGKTYEPQTNIGRWPANVALDDDAAALLDAMSGASRFFYVAKASRSERNAGLDGMPERPKYDSGADFNKQTMWNGENGDDAWRAKNPNNPQANHHPTVKPIALMRWLVRLVTPPDGVVCDPFLGSGTTGCAAVLEGFDFIGIEQDAEYLEIARRRIAHWSQVAADAAADAPPEQLSLAVAD